MGLVVPEQSEALILSYLVNKIEPQDCILHLYTNSITPDKKHVTGSFIEIAEGGYASVTLNPANWKIIIDSPCKASYPVVTFKFNNSVGNVYGYYITRTDGKLICAEKFIDGPYNVKNNGDEIQVTPIITIG